MKYTVQQVKKMISEQFPQYQGLDVIPVVPGGHDNRTFRLGEELVIRIPSAQGYANQVTKEFRWLPTIGNQLDLQITSPIELGQANSYCPFPFTISKWIDGNSLLETEVNQELIAIELRQFLIDYQAVEVSGVHSCGIDTCYRGCNLAVYDYQTRERIHQLMWILPADKLLTIWESSLIAEDVRFCLVHGDIALGNILVHNNKLQAVIDFGQFGMGDPSCDYAIAWTYFRDESRQLFLQGVNQEDIKRAKGWALWKAIISIDENNLTSESSLNGLRVVNEIINCKIS